MGEPGELQAKRPTRADLKCKQPTLVQRVRINSPELLNSCNSYFS